MKYNFHIFAVTVAVMIFLFACETKIDKILKEMKQPVIVYNKYEDGKGFIIVFQGADSALLDVRSKELYDLYEIDDTVKLKQ